VVYMRELETRARPPARPTTDGDVYTTQHQRFTLETITKNPAKMWGVSFLPDGWKIVTEIDGPVRLINPEGTLQPPLANTPEIVRRGQGGMLDVAVHPDYADNGWVYLSFSEGEGDQCITSVVRGRIRDNRWIDEEVIYRADPRFRSGAGVHFGTRIVFRGGYVYFAIGDRGAKEQAQDLARPNGKIHRVHEDGRIPEDNPFAGQEALPTVWSYGHRNPQALAFHPETDELWSTEHGPRGGDELNRILPGRNYGWPKVTHGVNYNGTPITEHTGLPGLEPPVWHWTPSIAVCGMAFADADTYPAWKQDVLVGGLRAQVLERLRIDGENTVVEREVILKDKGRVRDVKTGLDGHLYLILEDNGSALVRLLPVP
ncbi:MAG: PQQ-dependent sugar dehydrogenase, partial [Kiritimatiellae bacterium]|jgi:glucose/arabinose dehydrogenase|nr:PQQ-dependent sugar dehydrogenase [Kiritimatiellia bacterium]